MYDQIFILGNPRSGTSLLRIILNAHSKICIPPECGFLLWLFKKYENWSINDLTGPLLDSFINDTLKSKKFETWGIHYDDLLSSIAKNKPQNYEELSQCIYLAYANKFNKSPLFLGDKNNYYIKHLEELNKLFNEKIILHLVRDGRDVAVSYRKIKDIPDTYSYKPRLPYKIKDIANEWNTNNLNIYNFYKNYKYYYILKYEDLLENPSQFLKSLLKKLHLDFEKEILNFYKINKLQKIEPMETLAWKKKTTKPIDSSNIGNYLTELAENEIIEFDHLAKESLTQYGYK